MCEQKLSILIFFFCLLFSLGISATSAQSRSEHEIILGTPDNDIAMDMTLDSVGNVIVVGRSEYTVDPWLGEFYAIKVSSTGETLWTKSWNVSLDDILVSACVDSEDNVLVSGVSNLSTGQTSGIIYKLAPDGVQLWSINIDNLSYSWSLFGGSYDCFDIELHPESDDFFVVGSVIDESKRTFVARYNVSGSLVWRTEWYGPSESFGSIASQTWISSQNWIVVSGLLYGGTDSWYPFDGLYLAAFDFDGKQVWNYTSYEPMYSNVLGELSAGFEINPDEYLYATSVGRNFDHVVRRTYDLNDMWSFDMIIDEYHSVVITGFTANGTNNLIGYGEVISLIAGESVIKAYRPAFSGIPPPQTLIFSFSQNGTILWYDFLVIGRLSEPCGCQFDSDGRLIVAGNTSPWEFETNDFYVVFGFVQTPFPVHLDSLAIYIFPLFNLFSLGSIWVFFRTRSRNIKPNGDSKPLADLEAATKILLLIEVVLFVVVYAVLIGPYGGGGPPSPLIYYPDWVDYTISGLFYGLPIPIAAYLVIWFKDRTTVSRNQ